MAEAAAALGAAAAAVQFFDFSLKALSLCKQIRDSEKGTTQANQELETCMVKLKASYDELKPDARLGAGDRPIIKARNDCVTIMDDLQTLLDDVKVKSKDKSLASAKAAFRVMKGKRRIEILQNKLSEAQRLFLLALNVDMKNDVARLVDQQETLNETIQNIVIPELRASQVLSATNRAKAQQASTDMTLASSAAHKMTHTMLGTAQQGQETSRKLTEAMQVSLSGAISKIEAGAESAIISAQAEAKRKDIVNSLYYPEMFDRQQSIKPPYLKTFEWIFDDSPLPEVDDQEPCAWKSPSERSREAMKGKFSCWLRSSEPLFWISGKAGSGKSSLMSLIQADPRTAKALSIWASDRQLFIFSFYFWRPGSPLQKSIRGILRSLLYQLARAKPTVVDSISEAKPAHYTDWTTISLLSALRTSLAAFQEDRIFLMVDGLDEYEDQYTELLDLLLDCQQLPSIKMCIASRPEIGILTKLKQFPSLCLQDLNDEDIKSFVSGRLAPYKGQLCSALISTLAKRAEGVFLWVVLVLNSVISGVLSGDDEQTIQARVDAAPAELHALFEQLLTKVDPEHFDTLNLCLFLLNEKLYQKADQGRKVIRCELGLVTASMPKARSIKNGEELLSRCVENSEHLVSRCKGLIQIRSWIPDQHEISFVFDHDAGRLVPADSNAADLVYHHRIQFVHRSAYDFLCGRETHHMGRYPWALGPESHQKMRRRTSEGLMTLLQHGPMSFRYGEVETFITDALIESAIKLMHGEKTIENDDMYLWMDDFHKRLTLWYPAGRTQLQVPNTRREALCSRDNLFSQLSWYTEYKFWQESISFPEYLNTRSDELFQHRHALAICSELLVHICWKSPLYLPLPPTFDRLLAFLEKRSTNLVTTTIRHLLEYKNMADGVFLRRASWSASEHADEGNLIANLFDLATELRSFHMRGQLSKFQDPFRLMQRYDLFLGSSMVASKEGRYACLSESGWRTNSPPLQMQIPAHTAWLCSQQSEPRKNGASHPTRFRMLCPSVRTIERTYGGSLEACNEDIAGICDVDVELLGTLLEEEPFLEPNWNMIEFPRFVGTKIQFTTCLEQVKNRVWANERGQMNAWQQLTMLYVVKKHFKTFWTILTLESLELAAITL